MTVKTKKLLCVALIIVQIILMTACKESNESTFDDTDVQSQVQKQADTSDGTAASTDEISQADEENGTVHIKTAEDMLNFAERVNAGEVTLNAILDNDIDMSGVCGSSIGNWIGINGLEGEFDGNGHVISNIYCVDSSSVAVFFNLKGSVKNLELQDVVMISSEKNAAGLVYTLWGTVENCLVSGSVTAHEYAGGIVYYTYKGSSIVDCVNEAAVEGGTYNAFSYTGGAAGIAAHIREGGDIVGCVNKGSIVSSGESAGGIFGQSYQQVNLVEECVNEGDVHGVDYIGGIGGYAGPYTTVNRCVNKGNVSGAYERFMCYAAGIVAYSSNVIVNCANHGNVEVDSGSAYGLTSNAVEGLVNCYNIGDVICGQSGYATAIGYSSSAVDVNLYNYGAVICTGTSGVLTDGFPSGLGGASSGTLNCWSREGCIEVSEDFSSNHIDIGCATAEEDFTNGTVLTELNGAVEKLNGGELQYLEDSGVTFSGWTTGADGLPCFDWE